MKFESFTRILTPEQFSMMVGMAWNHDCPPGWEEPHGECKYDESDECHECWKNWAKNPEFDNRYSMEELSLNSASL